ncbi:hypothetical protein M422DRAFT_273874 [Sphaerobolus stellatus SS14]|uniref:Uncharacterized protein n=1 Tax=Sphaerobolus stellatus (strain SS14) TaxID=990650 RepID=A0A0C9TTL0_SPHS4|nr:hypothetical protein M422DRAFT_273874 [Sphaerobolus stellatus SS14]
MPTQRPNTLPAITAITTLTKHPRLHSTVKALQLIGHIDTVVLSRRMTGRTSDIVEADEVRDRLISTLPRLCSLRSITLNAISLTSGLCTTLFYLPQLEHLALVDCRAPIPPTSIFRDRPHETKLVHVEMSFGSWTDTHTELELISAFAYGPKLQTLTTDQSQVLTSLLNHEVRSKLSHVHLHRLGEKDAGLVMEFLRSQRCSELNVLDVEDCEFPEWIESGVALPTFPHLRTYIGSPKLASLFMSSASTLQHVSLRNATILDDDVAASLAYLASTERLQSLDLQIPSQQFIDGTIWNTFKGASSTLRELRIHHNTPVESLQRIVIPICLSILPAMTCLEKLALLPTVLLTDCGWHTSAIRDIARRQPALQEISLSLNHVWLRLASTEWREFRIDDI